MKNLGILLLALGICLGAYALLIMDVTVKVDYPNGYSFGLPERVNNLSLMAQRQNYTYGAIFLVILGMGLLFYVMINNKNNGNTENREKVEKPKQKITLKWVLETIGIILVLYAIILTLFYCYIHYWSE